MTVAAAHCVPVLSDTAEVASMQVRQIPSASERPRRAFIHQWSSDRESHNTALALDSLLQSPGFWFGGLHLKNTGEQSLQMRNASKPAKKNLHKFSPIFSFGTLLSQVTYK